MGIELNGFFNDYKKMERRDFLKLAGAGAVGGVLACLVPELFRKKNVAAPTPFPSFTPEPSATPKKERVYTYGQYWIGESGVGVISELRLQENPDPNIVNTVKSKLVEAIPGIEETLSKAEPKVREKLLTAYIYDMVGEKGNASFIMASVNNEKGDPQHAFVAFWVDENGIQRPPVDGRIYAFYPLRIEEQEDKSLIIGIPDILNLNIQRPPLFYIDSQGQTYFYSPYTDERTEEDEPSSGIKIAMLAPLESPTPSLPELLGGDERYAQEIVKQGYAWELRADGKELWMDFGWGDGKELAFKQNAKGEFELEKFWAPAPEGWDKVSVEDIIGKGSNGNAFLYRSQYKDWYLRAKTTGKVRIERRRDFITGEKLPGYMVIVEAVSRQEQGTPKFTFEYVAHADDGDNVDMLRGGGMLQIRSVFDYTAIYTSGQKVDISFHTQPYNSNWKVYPWLEPTFPNNLSFVADPYAEKYLIIPNGFGKW